MVLVTGDTHANQDKWFSEIDAHINEGDTIIVAGDFGHGFWSDNCFSEEMFYDYIANQKYTVLFVDGNHEHHDKLGSMNVEMWHGGRVHKIRHNVIHLMRGEIYDDIDGMSIFVMGGGYSLDKSIRVEGISWFSEEMPSAKEYENALKNLNAHNNKVDVIITHTCPSESVTYLSTIMAAGIHDDVAEERELTTFLDTIAHTVVYDKWYFGHFHNDRSIWRNQTAIFDSIRDVKTGEIVHQWGVSDNEHVPFTENIRAAMIEYIKNSSDTQVLQEELESVTRTAQEFIEEFGLKRPEDK